MRSLCILVAGLALLLTACGDTTDEPEPAAPTETVTVTETATEAAPTPDVTPITGDACGELEPGSQVTDMRVLFVSSPTPGATFASAGTVTGCTNAFEAAFQWELLDGDGQVLASGNETATCGSGCLGTFEFTVDYTIDVAQVGTLRVFTESAEDGSVQDENRIPVRLEP